MKSHCFANKILGRLSMTALALVLLAGCGSGLPTSSNTNATAANVASLQLSATATTIPTDNSSPTTITVTALNASNAALSGVVINLATSTGIVSAPSVTTNASGSATFTFSSGVASQASRTATITATAGTMSASIPIQITGAALKFLSATNNTIPNDGSISSILSFSLLSAAGSAVPNTAFTASWATQTGNAQVAITPTSGQTNAQGQFTVTATGVAGTSGTARVSATAAGTTAFSDLTINPAASTFSISKAVDNMTGVTTVNPTTVSMFTSDTLTITANAPAPITTVTFVTTSGTFGAAGTNVLSTTVAVAAGVATATLTSPPAGVTSITAQASSGALANLSVAVTSKVPASITVQPSPGVVQKSVGSTTGVSTVIATVKDATGAPVGGAPVSFSLSNTTGGGESISPVLVYTATTPTATLALGQASATFTAGSLSSSAAGVQVHAAVLGTGAPGVATWPNNGTPNTSPSGFDASIVIGGTPGSIAFGMSSKIVELNTTTYQMPMSILVSDVAGNPVPNVQVTLKVWPAWFSTGSNCIADYGIPGTPGASGAGDTAGTALTPGTGTFLNEDLNGNLMLDTVPVPEDGIRVHIIGGFPIVYGWKDGALTPPNAAAGSLPSTVTTDANGLASFYLTYLKSSAVWTGATVTASTPTQGSQMTSQTSFQLPVSVPDSQPGKCYAGINGASPYFY